MCLLMRKSIIVLSWGCFIIENVKTKITDDMNGVSAWSIMMTYLLPKNYGKNLSPLPNHRQRNEFQSGGAMKYWKVLSKYCEKYSTKQIKCLFPCHLSAGPTFRKRHFYSSALWFWIHIKLLRFGIIITHSKINSW